MNEITKDFYEDSYDKDKLEAQRRWPNEEFCRFMGRNFFKYDSASRKNIRILEVGCGSGANLRLLADEGFNGYGIDLSEHAIELVPLLLKGEKVSVKPGDMTKLEYEDNFFDGIVDVFSSYCLTETLYERFLGEVYRVLKTGGKFFSYTPSKKSDTFTDYEPSIKLDESTLDGIRRETAPFFGNFYPFRFMDVEDINNFYSDEMFKINYIETVGRSYNKGSEYFEFLVFEVEKI